MTSQNLAFSESPITTQALTPENIAGLWGSNNSNSFDYDRTGVLPQVIITDDGVPRTAYAYSLTQQRTLYDRPQHEWETPTRVNGGFKFSPDGTFESYAMTESGTMPTGYIKLEAFAKGTYTIQGEYVALNYAYSFGTVYNDLDNYYNARPEIPAYTHLKLTLGDENTPPTMSFFVQNADGSLTPWDKSPLPTQMQRAPLQTPINPTQGLALTGIAGNDVITGSSLNDIFFGAGGADTITTGNGSDRIGFDKPSEGGDLIQDFNPNEDILAFFSAQFPGLPQNSFITPEQFHLGAAATNGNQRFIYNQGTGQLFFDADGNGATAPVLMATLANKPTLTARNIYGFQDANILSSITLPGGGAQPPATVIESAGNADLLKASTGYQLKPDGGNAIALQYNGQSVTDAVIPGWQAIGVEAKTGGYEVIFRHQDGSFAHWDVDANGNYVNGRWISSAEAIAKETAFQQDFNGDGQIGSGNNQPQPPATVVEAAGNADLLKASTGYQLKPDGGNAIALQYNGQSVTDAVIPGWQAIGVEAKTGGYEVIFRHQDGSFAHWDVDVNGNYVNGRWISAAEAIAKETTFQQDFNGDGQIGNVNQPNPLATLIERTGNANPFNAVNSDRPNGNGGITVGYVSRPTFADIDRDGDQDLIVGASEAGELNYYRNDGNGQYTQLTGTGANPLQGINTGNFAAPAFMDWDGDGDLDAFVGSIGTREPIAYFRNDGAAGFTKATATNPFNTYNTNPSSIFNTLAFADLDKDGDLDAFTGGDDGRIYYLQNNGGVLTQLMGAANPFNDFNQTVGSSGGEFSTPSFADLDGDGDLDAVVGHITGRLIYLQNNNGALTVQPEAANPFQSWNDLAVQLGDRNLSAPTFVDVDGDGDLDVVVGNEEGKLRYLENRGNTNPPPGKIIESVGNSDLLKSAAGYQLRPDGGAAIALQYNGQAVTDAVIPGWQAIGVEAKTGGYEVIFRHQDGNFAEWDVDVNGNYVNGRWISAAEAIAKETAFQQDFNGDGQIGQTNPPEGTIIEANGNVTLLNTATGYKVIPLGDQTPTQVTYNGANLTESTLTAWNLLAAEVGNNGYELIMKSKTTAGRYQSMTLDGNGVYQSFRILNEAEVIAKEPDFYQDLNGDGQVDSASAIVTNTASLVGNAILVGGESSTFMATNGQDQFVFSDWSSQGTTIVDFSTSQDQLVFSDLFSSLVYTGNDPINDSYLPVLQIGADNQIQVDIDGKMGNASFETLVTPNNVNATSLVMGVNMVM